MSAPTITGNQSAGPTGVRTGTGVAPRLATETKASFKTTEFWAFVVVVVGILLSALLIKGGDTGGTDEFIARQAWLYVAIVTGAYLIARGLAKSGSHEPYSSDSGKNYQQGDEARR